MCSHNTSLPHTVRTLYFPVGVFGEWLMATAAGCPSPPVTPFKCPPPSPPPQALALINACVYDHLVAGCT